LKPAIVPKKVDGAAEVLNKIKLRKEVLNKF